MSNLTQTARSKQVTAENATIYNLSMPTANTEYSQLLNNETKRILIRMRNRSRSRVAFVSGGTTTAWVTIEPGAVFFEQNLSLTGVTIYIQADQDSSIAEILEWT